MADRQSDDKRPQRQQDWDDKTDVRKERFIFRHVAREQTASLTFHFFVSVTVEMTSWTVSLFSFLQSFLGLLLSPPTSCLQPNLARALRWAQNRRSAPPPSPPWKPLGDHSWSRLKVRQRERECYHHHHLLAVKQFVIELSLYDPLVPG